jgi:hypothetical protein
MGCMECAAQQKRANLCGKQFKYGISRCDRTKAFGGRTGAHGKKPLHRGFVAIQIQFQYLRLVCIGDGPQPVLAFSASASKQNFASHFSVAHPLRSAAWRDQIRLASELKQIHRRRINASCFAPAYLQELHVSGPDPQANQKTEDTVEKPCDGAGLL